MLILKFHKLAFPKFFRDSWQPVNSWASSLAFSAVNTPSFKARLYE